MPSSLCPETVHYAGYVPASSAGTFEVAGRRPASIMAALIGLRGHVDGERVRALTHVHHVRTRARLPAGTGMVGGSILNSHSVTLDHRRGRGRRLITGGASAGARHPHRTRPASSAETATIDPDSHPRVRVTFMRSSSVSDRAHGTSVGGATTPTGVPDGPATLGTIGPPTGPARSTTLQCMFARYFVELPLDPRIVWSARCWRPQRRGCRDSRSRHTVAANVCSPMWASASASASREVASIVEVATAPATSHHDACCRSVGGRRAAGLFPALDADLEVAALAPAAPSSRSARATTPPLGSVGARDRPGAPVPGRGGHAQGLPRPRGRRVCRSQAASAERGTSPVGPPTRMPRMTAAAAPRDAGRRPRDRPRRHPGDAAVARTTSS